MVRAKVKRKSAALVTWNPADKWDVEVILAAKLAKDRVTWLYRVKWFGWENAYNSWEPQDSLAECQDLVDRFWKAVGGRKGLGRNRGHIHIKGRPDYIRQEKAISAMRPKLRMDGKRTGLTITIPPKPLLQLESNNCHSAPPSPTPSPTLSDSDSLEFGSDDSLELQYPASDSDEDGPQRPSTAQFKQSVNGSTSREVGTTTESFEVGAAFILILLTFKLTLDPKRIQSHCRDADPFENDGTEIPRKDGLKVKATSILPEVGNVDAESSLATKQRATLRTTSTPSGELPSSTTGDLPLHQDHPRPSALAQDASEEEAESLQFQLNGSLFSPLTFTFSDHLDLEADDRLASPTGTFLADLETAEFRNQDRLYTSPTPLIREELPSPTFDLWDDKSNSSEQINSEHDLQSPALNVSELLLDALWEEPVAHASPTNRRDALRR